MRKLTVVGLKLIGVLWIIWGLATVNSQVFYMQMVALSNSMQHVDHSTWRAIIAGLVLAIVVYFGAGAFLLFRTSWITERIGLPDDSFDVTIEPYQFLHAGFLLVGTYILLGAVPDAASRICAIIFGNFASNPFRDPSLTNLITPVLRILLGYIVIVRSRNFARSVFPPATPVA